MTTIQRTIASALTVLLLAVLALPSTYAQSEIDETYTPGEVVVQLANAADLAPIAQTFALDPAPIDQFGTRTIYRLRILDGATPPTRAAAMTGDARVLAAEPNYVGQTPEGRAKSSWAGGGDGGAYTGQWAPAAIGLPEAHQTTRGADAVVAVLDTGVDATHPDLQGRLVAGYDFVDLDSDPREENPDAQAYGHGTHVAGLVALAAPDTRIMPVRMLDPDGVGNLWVTIEALAYAVNPDGDPGTADGADVINLSFSFLRRSTILDTVVREVVCEDDDDDDDDDDCGGGIGGGAVVVAAAGNSASTTPEYPAAEGVAGVLSVAATTEANVLASFSNRGAWVNISAPGAAIISSVPGGGYGTWNGTSMAAPLVAGSAALLRSNDSGLSPADVAAQLIATGAPSADIPPRLDVARALRPVTDLVCQGNVNGGAIANLRVPSGTACNVRGARVTGNLDVETGASLTAVNLNVVGNIQADEGTTISVDGARVGGNIQVEKSTGSVRLVENTVRGDMQVKENRGGVTILSNDIMGSLQCEENTPPPTGNSNRAKQFEGQCSGFDAAAHYAYLPVIAAR